MLLAHTKLFKKTKRGPKIASLSHFQHSFWKKKTFLLLYSITWPNFIVSLSLLREILENCLSIRLWRHKSWNWLYLSNQAVFSKWPKVQDKNLIILRTEKAFKIKYKAFFTSFKRLLLKLISSIHSTVTY